MIKKIICFSLLFLTLCPLVFAQESQEETLEGEIVEVLEERETDEGGVKEVFQKLEILVTKGSLEGQKIVVETQEELSKVGQVRYEKGEEVLLSYSRNVKGEDVFYITDYVRRHSLFWLLVIFLTLSLLVAKWRGLTSFVGTGVSFLIIIKLILPQILLGRDPILIAIFGAVLMVPITFYLSHGVNRKTTVAILGSLVTLAITGLLAKAFIEGAKLTGFTSDEAAFLKIAKGEMVNIKGLLLAGIIIGSLGILDDITISQAAIVEQLKKANTQLLPKELFSQAMNVGQDHIASMVNTLILVYTGAALPLLLLFVENPHPFSEVISYEIVAEEIVRSLVSSIGLILAVPMTTFLAVNYNSLVRIFSKLRPRKR